MLISSFIQEIGIISSRETQQILTDSLQHRRQYSAKGPAQTRYEACVIAANINCKQIILAQLLL